MTTHHQPEPSICATAAHHLQLLTRVRQHIASVASAVVFFALVENTPLDDGESTTALSAFELASLTGMTPSAVQRALNNLRMAGLIARHQLVKQKGCVSLTLITPKGLDIITPSVAGVNSTSLPASVLAELVGESLATTQACARAWAEGTLPSSIDLADYRGGAAAYERLMALLRANVETRTRALEQAIADTEAAKQAEAQGRVTVPLSDGSMLELDSAKFAEVSPRSVDLAFVKDVLFRVMARGHRLTPDLAIRLAGEICYSRAAGFVRDHAWEAGVAVLASCVTRPTWTKPRSITPAWYASVAKCSSVRNLSTAPSDVVH
ncbi:hypothetical protein [Rhodanobacter denitrificans]|uniref:hypothetical protein n=1 Tax=Rhodanobacter denitrificans TaxID=666685 RepID=UPI001F18BCE6|nr:hypothetical protein [Rhodanobacter denitrificans]UJJ60588.1 hypothetical protein LRK55_19330 [Rhodanobacter denitrificans]